MKKRYVGIIIAVCLIVTIAIGFLCAFLFGIFFDKSTEPIEPETTREAIETSSETAPAETTTETEETTTEKETPDVSMYDNPTDRFLYSITDIDTMILVIGDQYAINSGVLYYYEKVDGEWICTFSDDAWCGSNGYSNATYEGDRTTPVGLFELGVAFGNNPNPGTALEWIDVNEHLYWVDDNTSKYYNQLIDDREVPTGWNSGEHLISYGRGYAYSINIEVNPPYETSAIFLHCHAGATSTAGCVGISEEGMVWILQNIKPDTRIAIVEYEEDLDNIDHLRED